MTAIIRNLHIFIILWTAYGLYEGWEAHNLKYATTERKIPSRKNILKKKRKERDQLNSYFADVEAAKKRINRVAEEIEKLQKQLPAKISDTENLDLLSRISESTNLRDVFLSPGKEEQRGFYFAKKYKFKAAATYLQFLIFFESLADAERILNVKKVKLTQSKKRQKGRFRIIQGEVEVESYRYNPNFKENTNIKKLESMTKKEKKRRKK